MKLKQRLLLAPILIFLYLITKPHWSDDDSPWEHRSRYVGKVVRRDPSDHPYQVRDKSISHSISVKFLHKKRIEILNTLIVDFSH